MNAVRQYLPSLVDFRVPESWIGSDLLGNSKKTFNSCKALVECYYNSKLNHQILIQIADQVNIICHMQESMLILEELFKLLRIRLLAVDPQTIEQTVILVDFLIKNCDFHVHVCIGKRKFMKTMSVVGRRQVKLNGYAHRCVAEAIFDAVQAWGEAFLSRRQIYPHIWQTYMSLKVKHKVHFRRPDFDPTRVPIFLPILSAKERSFAQNYYIIDDNYGCIWSNLHQWCF